MKIITTTLALMLFLSELVASTFESESYFIHIESLCPEGNVTCDDVRFTIKEKKAGLVSKAIGRTLHSIGKDGITPSRFLGYKFTLNSQSYIIRMDGILLIRDEAGNTDLEEFGALRATN
ncbi:hypothetical protein ACWPKO_13710 [Coraliomargarita sp. W4R53]